VARVHAIEPEPHLRALATAVTAVPITVHDAATEHLPLPDASTDTAVFCLVLCSIPNRAAALTEARRMLR
jgi:ubiquinone/menaquinone biosynthesis C-methylase UbiE